MSSWFYLLIFMPLLIGFVDIEYEDGTISFGNQKSINSEDVPIMDKQMQNMTGSPCIIENSLDEWSKC